LHGVFLSVVLFLCFTGGYCHSLPRTCQRVQMRGV
jgi:hypothetical protein